MARTQDDHKLFGNVVGAVRRSLCTFHRRSLTSHFVSGVYRLSMIETVITSKITDDLLSTGLLFKAKKYILSS